MTEVTWTLHSTLVLPKKARPQLSTDSTQGKTQALQGPSISASSPQTKQSSQDPVSLNRLASRVDLTYAKPKQDPNTIVENYLSQKLSPPSNQEKINTNTFRLQFETQGGTIIRMDKDPSGETKLEILGRISEEELTSLKAFIDDIAELRNQFQQEGEASLTGIMEEGFTDIADLKFSIAGREGDLTLDYTKTSDGFRLNTSLADYDFNVVSDHSGAMIGGYDNDLSQFRQDVLKLLNEYKQDEAMSEHAQDRKAFILDSLAFADRIDSHLLEENKQQELAEPLEHDKVNQSGQLEDGELGEGEFNDFEILISTPKERFNPYNSGEISEANISITRESKVHVQSDQVKTVNHKDEIKAEISQHKGVAGGSVIHANFGAPDESGGQSYEYHRKNIQILRESFDIYTAGSKRQTDKHEVNEEELFVKRIIDGQKVDKSLNKL